MTVIENYVRNAAIKIISVMFLIAIVGFVVSINSDSIFALAHNQIGSRKHTRLCSIRHSYIAIAIMQFFIQIGQAYRPRTAAIIQKNE